jgi:hypothetical protein
MAKDKDKKRSGGKKAKEPKKAKKASAAQGTADKKSAAAAAPTKVAKVAKVPKVAKVAKVAKQAKAKAADLATHPAVAEIVAASLVAAAAAIKNPQKARDMATAVGGELETASKEAVDRGSRFWQLALDIARRSIDALETNTVAGKGKSKPKKSAGK